MVEKFTGRVEYMGPEFARSHGGHPIGFIFPYEKTDLTAVATVSADLIRSLNPEQHSRLAVSMARGHDAPFKIPATVDMDGDGGFVVTHFDF